MRILQVMAGAKRGGAETAFVDMCLAMHEAGESIAVATRANDLRVPRLRAAGIKVYTLPFGGKVDVYTPWKMTRIIKKFKPDIVQTWMSRAPQKTPRWKKSMGVPRYLTVARLGSYYKMKYFKTPEYFVSITPDIKRYLVDKGVPEGNVRHVNNFAETEEVEKSISRAEFDTPSDAPLLLGLGRLHDAKAFDVLIKAAAQMEEVYLWIAGEGPAREELEALIKTLGVGERVKLLGWRADRAALFEACDICTFISRKEGFGTVFVQSWAQRVPVVVSSADGPRQFVNDGQDGLVVPIDDVDATVAAVQKLMNDAPLRSKLVENGYARYKNEFTKEQSVRGYLEFYHEARSREGL